MATRRWVGWGFLVALGVVLAWAAAMARRDSRFAPRDEATVLLSELVRLEGGAWVHRDETNRLFSGWVTEAYAGGALRSRSHVVDGRLEGVSEGWYTNGTLQIREHFVAGVGEGLVTKWREDGSKLSEGTARAGKFEGVFRRYHAHGAVAEELNMVDGQPHGVARSWYESGAPKAEARLEHGQLRESKTWPDAARSPATTLARTSVVASP